MRGRETSSNPVLLSGDQFHGHACEFCPAAAITSRKNCTASSCDELPTELPSQSSTRRSVGNRRRHSRTPIDRGKLVRELA